MSLFIRYPEAFFRRVTLDHILCLFASTLYIIGYVSVAAFPQVKSLGSGNAVNNTTFSSYIFAMINVANLLNDYGNFQWCVYTIGKIKRNVGLVLKGRCCDNVT